MYKPDGEPTERGWQEILNVHLTFPPEQREAEIARRFGLPPPERKKRPALVYLSKDHPYFSMTNSGGRVSKGRLAMAEHLGRPLQHYELVRYLDGNVENDSIDNLQLITRQDLRLQRMKWKAARLAKNIERLEHGGV